MFPSCLSLPTYLSIIHLLTIFFYSSLCSSRLKNKIWYGLLGSKELLQRSYRKLEERIQLEVRRKGPVSWARRKEIKWPQNHLSTISLVLLKLNSGSLTHSHGDKAWGFISVIDKKIIVWREAPPHLCKGLLCWYLKSQAIRATLFFQCDGEPISLPNLQGIVVLNITSYAGGVNFWGSTTATAVSAEWGMGWEGDMTLLSYLEKDYWTG